MKDACHEGSKAWIRLVCGGFVHILWTGLSTPGPLQRSQSLRFFLTYVPLIVLHWFLYQRHSKREFPA